MRLRNDEYYMQVLTFCLFAAVAILISVNAHAAKAEPPATREHGIYTVKDGDYLGSIAIANETTVTAIIEANNLTEPDKIYSGMELLVPGPQVVSDVENVTIPAKPKKKKQITIVVPKGFVLSRIAKVYGVSVSQILRANKRLSNPDNVQAGQKLIIPGVDKEIELVPPPPCYTKAVEFYRVRNDQTEMISLTYCNGRVNPGGVRRLSELSTPAHLDDMPFPLHHRLATLLQRVANKYPGKRIEIISGQRTRKSVSNESYHNKGQAIDFRVEGVRNRTLANFVRKFKNTGVGFYPNSVFIHMDTRDKNAFWIDYSRPGEKAIYGRAGMSKKQIDKIRKKRTRRIATAKIAKSEFTKDEKAMAPIEAAPLETDDIKDKIEAALQENLDEAEAAIKTVAEETAPAPLEES